MHNCEEMNVKVENIVMRVTWRSTKKGKLEGCGERTGKLLSTLNSSIVKKKYKMNSLSNYVWKSIAFIN